MPIELFLLLAVIAFILAAIDYTKAAVLVLALIEILRFFPNG
jgi:hypothetical protein